MRRPPSLFGPYALLAPQPAASPSLFGQLPGFEAPSVQLPELEPLNTPSAFSDPGMSAAPQREGKKRGWFGRFADSVRERLVPLPDTLAQMVSPEELRQIRRMSIGTDNPSATAMSGIASVLSARQGTRSQAQQEQMLRQRQEIMARYAAGPNDTPEQTAQRLYSMFTDLVNLGDYEGATKAGEVLKSQTELLRGPKPPEPVKLDFRDAGDRVIGFDPITGEVKSVVPKGAAPRIFAPSEAGRITPAQQRQGRNQIVDDFRADTRELQMAAHAYGVLRGSQDGTNPAQPIALLYAYARLLDPGSVVREGEIATLQKLGSIDDKIRRAISMAASGTLPPDITQYIMRQADSIVRQRYESFKGYMDTARTRAAADNVDISGMLIDPYERYGLEPKPSRYNPHGGAGAATGARARAALQPRP